MVTSAEIVSQIPNTNRYRVKVYAYGDYVEAENEKDLSVQQEAIVVVAPGITPAYKQGEKVYVCIEDNNLASPVIMGHLLTTSVKSSSDAKFNSLIVSGNTSLSKDTTIGEVTSDNILCLKGVKSNIQSQIDANITAQIGLLDSMVKLLDETFV